MKKLIKFLASVVLVITLAYFIMDVIDHPYTVKASSVVGAPFAGVSNAQTGVSIHMLFPGYYTMVFTTTCKDPYACFEKKGVISIEALV